MTRRDKKGQSAANGQPELKPAQRNHFFGGARADLLLHQIVYLMLLGSCALIMASVQLTFSLIGSGRRRWLGVAGGIKLTAIGASFWSWGVYGTPLTAWKLWGPALRDCWYAYDTQDRGAC